MKQNPSEHQNSPAASRPRHASTPADWRDGVLRSLLDPSQPVPEQVENKSESGDQPGKDAADTPAATPMEPASRRERRRAEKRHAVLTPARNEIRPTLRMQPKSPTPRHGQHAIHRWAGALSRAVRADTYPGDLERATQGVQQPVTTGRRIVVMSTEGGSGRSTTVATLAAIYGALRDDRVCAIDLASAPSPLGDRLSVETPVSPQQAIGSIVLNHPSTPEDMALIFAQPSDGVWVTHAQSPEDPVTELEVEELLTQVSRQCGVTVVECPPVLEDPRTQAALNLAHAVLVIGSTTGNGLRNALALHNFLADGTDQEHLPVATVMNNRVSDNPWSARELRRVLHQHGRFHHSMSYDRHLSTGRGIRIDHLSERHRLEWIRLAATALTLARGYGAAR